MTKLKENRYKILYIVSTLKRSGPTNQLYSLIKFLDKNVFEPTILTLSHEEKESRYEDFVKLGVSISSLNLSRYRMFIDGIGKLKKIVSQINPDIIHSSGIRADICTYKYLNKYNSCSTIHNYAYDDYVMKFGKIKGELMARIHLSVINKMKYPIACSYSIAEKLKEKHDIKCDIVQNGIDDDVFSPVSEEERKKLKTMLNLAKDKMLYISTGALILRKDPIFLIQAFKKFNISGKAQLLLLGDGPLKKECEKYKDDNILIKGRVKNVVDYLKASDVFVSVSRSEGLPLAVLEAMGVGLPLILSDIAPHKEILKWNHGIGKIFKIGNEKQLVECLNYYLNCSTKNIGLMSRDTLEKYFSAKVMSKSYQDRYKKILNINT